MKNLNSTRNLPFASTLRSTAKFIIFTGQQATKRKVKYGRIKKRYILTSRGSSFLIQSIAGTSMMLLKMKLQCISIALIFSCL